jgi:ankyrin repeat protein
MGQTMEVDRTPGIDKRPVRHKGLLAAGGCLGTVLVAALGLTALAYAVDWHFPTIRLFGSAGGCAQSDDDLIQAAANGDTNGMRSRLAKQADPDSVDSDGDTALACAVEGGHLDAARVLLDAGASPDGHDGQGGLCLDLTPASVQPANCNTPIAHAVEAGDADLVTLLVDHGADPTAGLYAASRKNRPALARILLDHGADPNASEGTSPLLYNVMFSNQAMVDLLLTHGADPNRGGPADAGTVMAAVSLFGDHGNNPDALKAFVACEQGTAPNLPPLVVAAGLGDATSTAALLAHGADPNGSAGFKPEVSPLAVATATNSTGVAALLVQAGARPLPVIPPPPASSSSTSVAC